MIIRLNKRLYSEDAVLEALKDFEEVCDGRIVRDYIEVDLKQKEEFDKPLDKEFCNYVLGLMKNRQ